MTAREIVNTMYENDDFSQWLGIRFIDISEGHCIIEMELRQEMTNGFDVAHGGISYSLADSAFAFASNSRGKKAVSIETSISHTRPVFPGDLLRAEATELNLSNSLAIYEVIITNQDDKKVALFKGTVYRKDEMW